MIEQSLSVHSYFNLVIKFNSSNCVSYSLALVSGTFYPCSIIVGRFVFVFTVVVAVAVVVAMFGTVVNHLVPFVSFTIFLHVAWLG